VRGQGLTRTLRLLLGLLLAGLMLSVQTSSAQDAKNTDVRPNPEGVKSAAARQEDLKFPAKASSLGIFSGLDNGFFRPDGVGPFPAVVFLHTCGGVRDDLRAWTKAALKLGYVVLIPDSMRGAKTNCFPPLAVSDGRRAKDAMDAVAHLAKQSFVDATRIYAVGFSQGTHAAEMVAGSALAAAVVSPGSPRFAAMAGLYGACGFEGVPPKLPHLEYLQRDTDRPLLLLMAEADNETPASFCLERLPKLKEAGAPVEWHVYPGNVTHCWDCSTLNGLVKTDFRGTRVTYQYSETVTEDSRKRVFEFFARQISNR
jgi:dienelactone hydrolase